MRYVFHRVAGGALILLGVSLVAFLVPALNTSPLALFAAAHANSHGVTASSIDSWIHAHGFDQPLWLQYWHWLLGALHGSFGVAYGESNIYPHHEVSVATVVRGDLWRTVWLVVPPTVVSVLVAIAIGLSQAVRRNRLYDHVMTAGAFVTYSTPTFFVCTVLSCYIGLKHLGTASVDPAFQGVPPSQIPSYIIDHFRQFFLPYVAIMLLSVGALTRFTRGLAVQASGKAYVRTAQAKGVGPWRVLFGHVLRPTVIPLIPIIGLTLPVVLSGAVVVEAIFNFPGLGAETFRSAERGDFSVVRATVFLAAVLIVAWNLVAHVCTAMADPRVRRPPVR